MRTVLGMCAQAAAHKAECDEDLHAFVRVLLTPRVLASELEAAIRIVRRKAGVFLYLYWLQVPLRLPLRLPLRSPLRLPRRLPLRPASPLATGCARSPSTASRLPLG